MKLLINTSQELLQDLVELAWMFWHRKFLNAMMLLILLPEFLLHTDNLLLVGNTSGEEKENLIFSILKLYLNYNTQLAQDKWIFLEAIPKK